MVLKDEDRPLDEAAALHGGLAHPVRVAVLRVLREVTELPVRELRRHVAERAGKLDTRSLQHHLYKMQVAGLVTVSTGEGGHQRARLLRDVRLKVRAVPG